MEIDFSKQKLPDIYMRNNTDCYLDTYREKLIPITPEETIRQKVARWCENTLSVPHEMISIEESLSHYGIESRLRADIVIHKKVSSTMYPIAIIECKSNKILLNDRTLYQGIEYADLLNCDYLFLTNGIDLECYHYEENQNGYIELSVVPSYNDMLEGKFIELEIENEGTYNRLSLKEIYDETNWHNFTDEWIIAPKSKKQIIPYAINIFECFLDCSSSIDCLVSSNFTLIKDYGIRYLDYGNASGGSYYNLYRSFLIKDNCGNHQFVSLGVNAYSENRTILCVAIDAFKTAHHALQLAFESYMEECLEKIKFTHSGRITIGKMGSGKASELIKYVKKRSPNLIKEDKVVLGELPKNQLLSFNISEVQDFVRNLIDYALLRDAYRNEIKKHKTNPNNMNKKKN